MEYGHPPITWVVENIELPIGKTNTPPRKEFSIAPRKKFVTLVLPSVVLSYRKASNRGICLDSMLAVKYKSIAHIPIMTQSPIPQNKENDLHL